MFFIPASAKDNIHSVFRCRIFTFQIGHFLFAAYCFGFFGVASSQKENLGDGLLNLDCFTVHHIIIIVHLHMPRKNPAVKLDHDC